jgi:iron-sulfur cluster repair protein YtfE (RIC family)
MNDVSTRPDLTGFTMVHRAMLTDTGRLADLTARLARTPAAIGAQRVPALTTHVTYLAREIHHHHTREDEVLWPVIQAAAGQAVDLAAFSDDHKLLDPVLTRLRETVVAFAAQPPVRIAALATAAAELSAMLHEHIPEEERDVFPVIRTYVPAGAWRQAERRMGKGVTLRHAGWLIPWIEHHATEPERRYLRREAPLPFRVLLRLNRGKFAALHRKAFA